MTLSSSQSLKIGSANLPSSKAVDITQPVVGETSLPGKQKICVHYRSNRCRHGMKGKECSFLHPERCKKLMQHGTKQPDGCNL